MSASILRPLKDRYGLILLMLHTFLTPMVLLLTASNAHLASGLKRMKLSVVRQLLGLFKHTAVSVINFILSGVMEPQVRVTSGM
jgi:hypothetical protein